MIPHKTHANLKTIGSAGKYLSGHGAYVFHVRGHVAAHIDGVTHDWAAGRRHRIVGLYQITW